MVAEITAPISLKNVLGYDFGKVTAGMASVIHTSGLSVDEKGETDLLRAFMDMENRLPSGNARVSAETKAYQKIPEIISFTDKNGNDTMQQDIDRNYKQIKADITSLIESEMERIKVNENLRHLVKSKE